MSLKFEFDELLSYDTPHSELFIFLDNNYEFVTEVIENKMSDYYYLIAKYPNLKKEDFNILEKINTQYAIHGLLENPNVSGEWLEKKLKSVVPKIKRLAAANPNLPRKAFFNIFKSNDRMLLSIILSNPSCPQEIIIDSFEKAIIDSEQNFIDPRNITDSIMKNVNFPNELFIKFVTDPKNRYVNYIRTILEYKNIDEKSLKLIDKYYGARYSSWYDHVLVYFSRNPNIKNNKLMQHYICEKIYTNMENIKKDRILTPILEYIDSDDIMLLYSKIKLDDLGKLVKNPNTPTDIVVKLIVSSKIIHIGSMYYGYNFTQQQLFDIVSNNTDDKKRAARFFNIYEDKFELDTKMKIYHMTNNEIFLPKETRDMFLF